MSDLEQGGWWTAARLKNGKYQITLSEGPDDVPGLDQTIAKREMTKEEFLDFLEFCVDLVE